MATIARASKGSSGTTEYADATTIEAAELNSDLNTLYNEINGSLDTDNIASVPWAKITGTKNPEDIDDTSATQAEHDTTQDPGDAESPPTSTSARTLPTNVEDEIQQLRYAVNRLAIGGGMVRRDTDMGTNEATAWFEHPVRGKNQILNGQFRIQSPPLFDYYDTGTPQRSGSPETFDDEDVSTVVANRAPFHWTKVSDPTTIALASTSTASGEDMEVNIVAADAGDGIQQTVTGLKASTRYLLRVTGRTASGTVNVKTTGATGAVYSNAALTITSTSDETVGSIILTDATPTDFVVKLLSAGTENFNIRSAELLELGESPDYDTYAGYTIRTELDYGFALTGAYADIDKMDIAVVCPGAGYEIYVTAHGSTGDPSGGGSSAGVVGVQIEENSSVVDGPMCVRIDTGNTAQGFSLDYLNDSPTAGTTYTYKLQGILASGSGIQMAPSITTVGQTTCAMTVCVRRRA